MFKFLFKRKPKKVRVLVVVNGDASVPVDYSNKIDVPLAVEVRAACDALAIPVSLETVSAIADVLQNRDTYWLEETWGFQVLEIEV